MEYNCNVFAPASYPPPLFNFPVSSLTGGQNNPNLIGMRFVMNVMMALRTV